MVKEKKITIKHYLNKGIRPKEAVTEGYYPVYTAITYDRKTTKINLLPGMNKKGVTEAEFKASEEEKGNTLSLQLKEVSKVLEQIIRFELKVLGESFDLRGISRRFSKYFLNISDVFNAILNKHFSRFLEDHLTVTQYKSLHKIDEAGSLLNPLRDEFIEVFKQVQEKYIPDIDEKIKHTKLEKEISCFTLLIVFENINGKASKKKPDVIVPKKYRFTDWVSNPSVKEKFQLFLEKTLAKATLESLVESGELEEKILLADQEDFDAFLKNNKLLANFETRKKELVDDSIGLIDKMIFG